MNEFSHYNLVPFYIFVIGVGIIFVVLGILTYRTNLKDTNDRERLKNLEAKKRLQQINQQKRNWDKLRTIFEKSSLDVVLEHKRKIRSQHASDYYNKRVKECHIEFFQKIIFKMSQDEDFTKLMVRESEHAYGIISLIHTDYDKSSIKKIHKLRWKL